MRRVQAVPLWLLVAALALIASSGATATTIRSGSATGPAYSGATTETNNGNLVINAGTGVGTVTCTAATFSGSVNSSGLGSITSASTTNCTSNLGQKCTLAWQNLSWSVQIGYTVGGVPADGTSVWTPANSVTAQLVCGSIVCYYGASQIGGDWHNPGTGSAQVVVNTTLAKKSGSSAFCGATATLNLVRDVVGVSGLNLWVTP